MTKLVLNVGDRVRNIRSTSPYFKEEGVVTRDNPHAYVVKLTRLNKVVCYYKERAHINLEKIEEPKNQCTCTCGVNEVHVCESCARQIWKGLTFADRYGAGRKVLKRERRNVITGKTQAEMQAQYGLAKGGVMFNTRVLGRSTGQAFRILGEAMCNPGIAIRYEDVDHAISEGIDNRHHLNKHFEQILRDTIGGLRGFTLDQGHVTFHPIVTEETYVTQ